MFSYAVGSSGGPVVFDLARDELVPVVDDAAYDGALQPRYVAYSAVLDRLLLAGSKRCDPGKLSDLPFDSVRCVPSRWGAAAYSGARPADLVAMVDGRRLLVLDSQGLVRMERFLPDGLAVHDVTWEDDATVLVLVATDAGSQHVLRCTAAGSCSRAYDGAPGESVVLSHSRGPREDR